MKILFFDTETTGLDAAVNGIHQLAGEIVIDGNVVDRIIYMIKPYEGCQIEKRALVVSRTNHEDLIYYPCEKEVYTSLVRLLYGYTEPLKANDKIFLAGWRAPEFDCKFLHSFFERNGGKETYGRLFWSNPIDIPSKCEACHIAKISQDRKAEEHDKHKQYKYTCCRKSRKEWISKEYQQPCRCTEMIQKSSQALHEHRTTVTSKEI